MKPSKTNILSLFLTLSNVKHTKTFANKVYNEHPHKDNLFGVSKMLTDYGVENKGYRLIEKEKDIYLLPVPFIAQAENDLVIVHEVTPGKIRYLRNGFEKEAAPADFFKNWTGVVLLAEADENSAEPDYGKNRLAELFAQGRKYTLWIAGILAATALYTRQGTNPGDILLLLLNLVGIFISYSLLLKQMKISSYYADKICSLAGKSATCNDVLESPAAKISGLIGWSEIGMGYFISNTLLLLLFPSLRSWLVLINICALPYSFWSVWYQKVKAKSWCPLCLIIQALLWGIFTVNAFSGVLHLPTFTSADMALAAALYIIPVLAINALLPKITDSNKIQDITQRLNNLKVRDEVFQALLQAQPHYEIDKSTSGILFGNPEAETLVTVLSNPHCEPCGRMHKKIDRLLKVAGDKICLQYIFVNFDIDVFGYSSNFLTAIYQKNEKKTAQEIYNRWFSYEKYYLNKTYEKYNIDINSSEVLNERQKHAKWNKKNKIAGTPTIFINGYELPNDYEIGDIRFI